MNRVPLTKEGYERLKEKLKILKEVERPRVIKALEEARGHGDLSENAEYESAKQEQALLEEKITKIEHAIAMAEVIDTSKLQGTKVIFGCFVTLFEFEKKEEITYQLVGDEESNITEGRISIKSPIGRALIGKEEGDYVVVNTPSKKREFEIVKVRFK